MGKKLIRVFSIFHSGFEIKAALRIRKNNLKTTKMVS